ncbi:triose-phosphate isomerase [Microbacterium sp. LMC-P-041]|uniref:triose-phosphate isomerase family protein n=1 Tax=Microbacterium sp. LMC-P-041 TaxID=3040293 RepID=UPI0025549239|nr:triose-phosphate isomerase [Microbacterium sp. LMC-P-041]
MGQVTVAVSLKTYFSNAEATAWFTLIAERVRKVPAVIDESVRVVVIPTYLQIPSALRAFRGIPVLIGAQDVSAEPPGAFTGEVSADELAEVGVGVAEVGHAERRRLFSETDALIAAKATAALRHRITPLVCVGEAADLGARAAALLNVQQMAANLEGVPPGAVIIAYEPVWAIGADRPAQDEHISTVTRALRAELNAHRDREGSVVIYGGSAGPGLLTRLGDAVDGVFLGRFAHDPDAFTSVLDEAAAIAHRD